MAKRLTEEIKNWLEVFCEVEQRKDVTPAAKKAAVKMYGKKTEYADEKNKKYPIDAEHIHAAISYWGMQKNRVKYSPEDQKKISAKISAAAKKHGVTMAEAEMPKKEEMPPKMKDKMMKMMKDRMKKDKKD